MWNVLVLLAGILSGPVLAFSYLPQILQILKSKNVEGISLSFWLILDVSLLCFVILAANSFIESGAWVLLAVQLLNLALALIVTIQVLLYRNKAVK